MEPIRIAMIICSPTLGLLAFLLFRHYNSGYDSLYSKRWYLRIAIITFILSISSISLYFVVPKNEDKKNANQLIIKANDVETILRDLDTYIKMQSTTLADKTMRLDQLNSELKRIEAVIQTTKETVDSIFELNDQRQKKQRIIDYGISFIMGVIITLIGGTFKIRN
jgi:hypothetical protein